MIVAIVFPVEPPRETIQLGPRRRLMGPKETPSVPIVSLLYLSYLLMPIMVGCQETCSDLGCQNDRGRNDRI